MHMHAIIINPHLNHWPRLVSVIHCIQFYWTVGILSVLRRLTGEYWLKVNPQSINQSINPSIHPSIHPSINHSIIHQHTWHHLSGREMKIAWMIQSFWLKWKHSILVNHPRWLHPLVPTWATCLVYIRVFPENNHVHPFSGPNIQVSIIYYIYVFLYES